MSRDRLELEVVGGKAVIEDALGAEVASFAYPCGRYDNQCREVVSHHFACACSDKLDLANGSSDLFALQRVDAYYLRTEGLFNVMSTRFFSRYIRTRSLSRRIRRSIQLGLGVQICASLLQMITTFYALQPKASSQLSGDTEDDLCLT